MTILSRLTSLELQGFKTFAGKIDFVFPGDITCIVGPNGSGKSNVSDAIRWVLGEQSYTLLRARKTEDMIFSGSSNRPRSGMASAVITFNNEDSWFPVDYSEVTIGRRAYRDGHNEYLLNGQRIRLKELSELLAQAGLTPRTYTIIGQGLVDAALSLRPDERRQFFEEAAGVSLHRRRREEAINRLSATRRNLDRVFDILNELKPRLRSLERQATRARQQDQLKADLRILMREWYGYLWHKTQDNLYHAREVLREQEKRLDEVKLNKGQLDQLVTEKQRDIAHHRENLSVWHKESSNLHNQLEALNRSIAVADERERALNERKQDLHVDIIQSDEVLAATEKQAARLQEEFESISKEKFDIEQSASAARTRLVEVEKVRNELTDRLNQINKKKNEAEIKKISRAARLRELNVRKGENSSSQVVIQKELKQLDATLHQESNIKKSVEKDVVGIQSELDQSESRISKLDSEIAALDKDWNNTRKNNLVLQEKQGVLSAKHNIMKTSIENNELLSSGAQSFYQEVSASKKNISLQSLSTLIDVPEEYELAIASALGEYLDAFLLEEENDIDEILAFIAEQDLGRVLLFTSRNGQTEDVTKRWDSSEVIGLASDYVKINQDSPAILEGLLQSILLVNGREAAKKMIAELPAHMCLATMNGDVFRGNGAIISGKEQRNEIFAVQRSLRKISIDLEDVTSQLSISHKRLSVLDEQLSTAKRHKEEESKTKLDTLQKLEEAQQKMRKIEFNLTQIAEQKKYLVARLSNLDKQLQEILSEIDEISRSLEELDAQIVQAEGQGKVFLAELKNLDFEDIQIEHNFWVTKAAVIEKSEVDAKKRLSEIQERFQNVQTQNSALKKRLLASDQDMQKTREDRDKLQSSLMEINAQLEDLNEKIQPAEQRIMALEGELRTQRTKLEQIQQKLSSAERYVTQAQLESSRRNDNLLALQEKIEDDFGLVSFEYQSEIVGPTPLPFAGIVDELPSVKTIPAELEENINRQKAQLRRLGPINPEAQEEYRSVKERYEFMSSQVDDLEKADEDLRQIISELDELMKTEFQRTFKQVAQEFRQMFTRLFGGGTAKLMLVDENTPTEAGIEIEAVLPGRRKQGLAVLSGGERSLTAVALIFALLKVSPTPFCVLDEVDAALDEANVGRFGDLLRELSLNTQFIVITHNRNTVQLADILYGVTMARDSTSQVISLKLDEIGEVLAE